MNTLLKQLSTLLCTACAHIYEIDTLIQTNIHTHTAKAAAKLALEAKQKEDREKLAEELKLAKELEAQATERAGLGATSGDLAVNESQSDPAAVATTDSTAAGSDAGSVKAALAAQSELAAQQEAELAALDGAEYAVDDDDLSDHPELESDECESDTDMELEETEADAGKPPKHKTRHRRSAPAYGPKFCVDGDKVNERYKKTVRYHARTFWSFFYPNSDFRKAMECQMYRHLR
jgi:hypothetical protein